MKIFLKAIRTDIHRNESLDVPNYLRKMFLYIAIVIKLEAPLDLLKIRKHNMNGIQFN